VEQHHSPREAPVPATLSHLPGPTSLCPLPPSSSQRAHTNRTLCPTLPSVPQRREGQARFLLSLPGAMSWPSSMPSSEIMRRKWRLASFRRCRTRGCGSAAARSILAMASHLLPIRPSAAYSVPVQQIGKKCAVRGRRTGLRGPSFTAQGKSLQGAREAPRACLLHEGRG